VCNQPSQWRPTPRGLFSRLWPIPCGLANGDVAPMTTSATRHSAQICIHVLQSAGDLEISSPDPQRWSLVGDPGGTPVGVGHPPPTNLVFADHLRTASLWDRNPPAEDRIEAREYAAVWRGGECVTPLPRCEEIDLDTLPHSRIGLQRCYRGAAEVLQKLESCEQYLNGRKKCG
jgi:hypothetical protein